MSIELEGVGSESSSKEYLGSISLFLTFNAKASFSKFPALGVDFSRR